MCSDLNDINDIRSKHLNTDSMVGVLSPGSEARLISVSLLTMATNKSATAGNSQISHKKFLVDAALVSLSMRSSMKVEVTVIMFRNCRFREKFEIGKIFLFYFTYGFQYRSCGSFHHQQDILYCHPIFQSF